MTTVDTSHSKDNYRQVDDVDRSMLRYCLALFVRAEVHPRNLTLPISASSWRRDCLSPEKAPLPSSQSKSSAARRFNLRSCDLGQNGFKSIYSQVLTPST